MMKRSQTERRLRELIGDLELEGEEIAAGIRKERDIFSADHRKRELRESREELHKAMWRRRLGFLVPLTVGLSIPSVFGLVWVANWEHPPWELATAIVLVSLAAPITLVGLGMLALGVLA